MADITPVGGTMVLMGHVFEVVGHTTDANGQRVEIPGRRLGPAPQESPKRATKASSPVQPIRRPQTKCYRHKPRQAPAKKIVYQTAPLTGGELWFLVIAAALFAVGYVAMCIHDKAALTDYANKVDVARRAATGGQ